MNNRIRDARPDRLSLLLSIADSPDDISADFARILEEQLRLPVLPSVNDSGTSELTKLQQIACSASPPIETFGDLLDRLHAPIELLIWGKDAAKVSSQSLVSFVPAEVASVLYYSYIAAALGPHDRLISELSLADLQRGFEWCLKQSWLNKNIAKLIRDGQTIILLRIRQNAKESNSRHLTDD